MSQILPHQIVGVVADAFAADPNMLVLVPGGIWHQRAAALERPYAILRVTAGEQSGLSDLSVVQTFHISVAVYGDDSADNTGAIVAQLASWDLDATLLAALPCRVLIMAPDPGDLELDPEEKLGADVLIVTKAWTLVLHALIREPQTT